MRLTGNTRGATSIFGWSVSVDDSMIVHRTWKLGVEYAKVFFGEAKVTVWTLDF